MTITVKDLRKILKSFPPETPINIHWQHPTTLEGEGHYSPFLYEDFRVKIEGEVMARSSLLYRLGGKKFYLRGEERIYKEEVEEIIIG